MYSLVITPTSKNIEYNQKERYSIQFKTFKLLDNREERPSFFPNRFKVVCNRGYLKSEALKYLSL